MLLIGYPVSFVSQYAGKIEFYYYSFTLHYSKTAIKYLKLFFHMTLRIGIVELDRRN